MRHCWGIVRALFYENTAPVNQFIINKITEKGRKGLCLLRFHGTKSEAQKNVLPNMYALFRCEIEFVARFHVEDKI